MCQVQSIFCFQLAHLSWVLFSELRKFTAMRDSEDQFLIPVYWFVVYWKNWVFRLQGTLKILMVNICANFYLWKVAFLHVLNWYICQQPTQVSISIFLHVLAMQKEESSYEVNSNAANNANYSPYYNYLDVGISPNSYIFWMPFQYSGSFLYNLSY
jgi:hypothetical protein